MNNYCVKCGHQIDKNMSFCAHCGNPIRNTNTAQDKIDVGLNSLAFLLPFVGFILYLVNLSNYPRKAKCIGKYTLIGFILRFSLYLIVLPHIGIRIIPIGYNY